VQAVRARSDVDAEAFAVVQATGLHTIHVEFRGVVRAGR
jgi:hypothetical protein